MRSLRGCRRNPRQAPRRPAARAGRWQRRPAVASAPRSAEEVFAAVSANLTDPDALRRYAAIHDALRELAPDQVGSLLDRLDHLPKHWREKVKPLVFTQLCLRFPSAAHGLAAAAEILAHLRLDHGDRSILRV